MCECLSKRNFCVKCSKRKNPKCQLSLLEGACFLSRILAVDARVSELMKNPKIMLAHLTMRTECQMKTDLFKVLLT